MDRGRKLGRRAVTADVHVHHVRGLVQQMVVERRLLDAAFLELREHRADLVLEQHEVAHQHRLGVAHLLERDPRAKRQCGLHGHTADRDVEVTARHPDLVGPVRLQCPGLSERHVHLFPVDGRERLLRLLAGGHDQEQRGERRDSLMHISSSKVIPIRRSLAAKFLA